MWSLCIRAVTKGSVGWGGRAVEASPVFRRGSGEQDCKSPVSFPTLIGEAGELVGCVLCIDRRLLFGIEPPRESLGVCAEEGLAVDTVEDELGGFEAVLQRRGSASDLGHRISVGDDPFAGDPHRLLGSFQTVVELEDAGAERVGACPGPDVVEVAEDGGHC